MPDEIDLLQGHQSDAHERLLAQAREGAKIPDGKPGECHHCGKYSLRLVSEHCARCRDELKQ